MYRTVKHISAYTLLLFKSARQFGRSFFFRAQCVVFIAISLLLLGQRIFIYHDTVHRTYEDIKYLIGAHEDDFYTLITQQGINAAQRALLNLPEKARDKSLYMALKHKNQIWGNVLEWPEYLKNDQDYAEATVMTSNYDDPVRMLVSIIMYDDDTYLLTGYDLLRIEDLEDEFWLIFWQNLLASFFASWAVSLLIVWLLSRHFRQFNRVCTEIMSGNLSYRLLHTDSKDEFSVLARHINQMLDWIKSLLQAVQASSNAIAHDMRTPLSQLRLKLRALPATQQELLSNHVARLDDIIHMFDQVLVIAKVESKAGIKLFDMIDIVALLRDILDFYAPIIEEKSFVLHTSIPVHALYIKGDKQLLGQAMMNVLDNACKYTPEHGQIAVILNSHAQHVSLEIIDTGVGISEELLHKVTERFFRVDSSRHTHGHGLGLSLVEAVMQLHRGHLIIAHNTPRGLKVVLRFNF